MKSISIIGLVVCLAYGNLICETPKFYLAVNSGNEQMDVAIFNVIKFGLPKCIITKEIFNSEQAGIVEFYVKAVNEESPEPFMTRDGFSSHWFHRIQGDCKIRIEPEILKKTVQKVLFPTKQIYCMRVYTIKTNMPIVYEMEVNINFADVEMGMDFLKTSCLGRISRMMQKIARDVNGLCNLVNELE
jgi:hypothetical protein